MRKKLGKTKGVKPGKVVRLTPDLVRLVEANKLPGEKIHSAIRRLMCKNTEDKYALLSDLCDSIEDARGRAVQKAVRSKTNEIEKPVIVRINK